MDELHFKNVLVAISEHLKSNKKSIRDITLLEFQQRVWSKIWNLWNTSERKQTRTLAQIQIKTYKWKVIDDLERWY